MQDNSLICPLLLLRGFRGLFILTRAPVATSKSLSVLLMGRLRNVLIHTSITQHALPLRMVGCSFRTPSLPNCICSIHYPPKDFLYRGSLKKGHTGMPSCPHPKIQTSSLLLFTQTTIPTSFMLHPRGRNGRRSS